MVDITDWPAYRAGKIVEWEKELDRLLEQKAKTMDLRVRDDLDAVIEGVIEDIDNYRCQQASEGH